MAPILVTVKEAAALLSLSPWRVYQLINQGVIPCVRLGTRSTRIRVDTLQRLTAEAEETRGVRGAGA